MSTEQSIYPVHIAVEKNGRGRSLCAEQVGARACAVWLRPEKSSVPCGMMSRWQVFKNGTFGGLSAGQADETGVVASGDDGAASVMDSLPAVKATRYDEPVGVISSTDYGAFLINNADVAVNLKRRQHVTQVLEPRSVFSTNPRASWVGRGTCLACGLACLKKRPIKITVKERVR